MSLEADFIEFLANDLAAQSLDEDGDKEKRPDFLWRDQLLIELKSLQTSPQPKVEKTLEPERNSPEWPLAFGMMNPKHFEGTQIQERNKKKLVNAIQKAVRGGLQTANKQIMNYCKTHNKRYGSVVVFLNETLAEHTPEMVMHAVQRELKSGESSGRTNYDGIGSIVYLSEKHFVGLNRRPFAAYYIGHMLNPDVNTASQAETQQVLDAWCKRSSSPPLTVYKGDGTLDNGIIEIVPDNISLSDSWKIEYRKSRSMKGCTKKRLTIEFCKCMMLGSLAGIKGAPRANDQSALMRVMKPFTEVMEELAIRGEDMKTIVPTRSIQKKAIRELRLNIIEQQWLKKNFVFHANGEVHSAR